MKQKICPFCNNSVSLVDSAKVYSRSYGLIYLCDSYPTCDAKVGCHPGTITPLGTLANAELRRWRSRAHGRFDFLWKSGFKSRKAAYRWLSEELGLPKNQTHIGMFNKEQCQSVVMAVEELIKSLKKCC